MYTSCRNLPHQLSSRQDIEVSAALEVEEICNKKTMRRIIEDSYIIDENNAVTELQPTELAVKPRYILVLTSVKM